WGAAGEQGAPRVLPRVPAPHGRLRVRPPPDRGHQRQSVPRARPDGLAALPLRQAGLLARACSRGFGVAGGGRAGPSWCFGSGGVVAGAHHGLGAPEVPFDRVSNPWMRVEFSHATVLVLGAAW